MHRGRFPILRCLVTVLTVAPCLILLGSSGGCLIRPWNPAATQPATVKDLATTQPGYWLSQPPTAGVRYGDFDRLWKATEGVTRHALFTLDRDDYRLGLLTSKPLVSRQFFEPWRPDVRTLRGDELSSTATIRRTLQFYFTRVGPDLWVVTPIVLVERNEITEKRLTATVNYRDAYTIDIKSNDLPGGTREQDLGIFLPARYWYITGRDTTMEMYLARQIKKWVPAATLTQGPASTQPAATQPAVAAAQG